MINILIPSMQDVQNGVIVAIRTLLLHLCEPIYKLIVFCFQIFEGFGKLRLFENSNVIGGIYNRIGLILGLFMIFRISFSAIEYIINPDNMLDKEKGFGNIIKKVLIVIVLLGSTRFLFDAAYNIQDRLIDSQIVSKILLSDETVNEANKGGSIIAWEAFRTFYRINPEASGSDTVTCTEMMNEDGVIYQNFFETEDSLLDSAGYCLNTTDENDNNIIIFNGIFCLGVGLFLLWTIFTYTIQAGVRVLQLAYLELIAPIPIMMYLIPDGDSKLKSWGQQCLTTFLDFFIRVAIMNFIVIVSGTLIDFQENIFGYFGDVQATDGNLAAMYIILIMIIALMIFAKRIPKLLGEILPSVGGTGSLGFGFGMPSEAKQVGGFLGRTATRTAGAVAGGVINAGVSAIDNMNAAGRIGRNRFGAAMHGLGSGALIGIRNGARGGNIFKNFSAGWNARKASDRSYEQLLAQGGSATGKIKSQITSHIGLTEGQEFERKLSNAKRMDEYVKNVYSAIEEIDDVKKARAEYEHFDPKNSKYKTRAEALKAYQDTRKYYADIALDSKKKFSDYTTKDGKSKLEGNTLLHLTEARQNSSAANAFSSSVNATYIDLNGNEGKFEQIKDIDSLDKAGFNANTTETMISGSPRYIKTKAEDEAAGVNKTNNS